MKLMAARHPIPLPDYQRIYQVTYSVLETSGIAVTHRACILFASVGALLLREHYKRSATFSAGCMALMVDEAKANVVLYGREESGVFVSDEKAFHAWVECDGWLVDFMAPIMGEGLRADGQDCHVPRRMLQRPLQQRKDHPRSIQQLGEFYLRHDSALAERLLDHQRIQFEDLVRTCCAWFRRPPKRLPELKLADTHGPTRKLVLRAPSIDGVW
jgi:hypothetical protein